jgi:hypothetical protein
MMLRPHYFESIRQAAAKRWYQLEADSDPAGPWYQLFKQVQSPRHVLSAPVEWTGARSRVMRDDGHIKLSYRLSHDNGYRPAEVREPQHKRDCMETDKV